MPAAQKMTVMICDDEPDLLQLFAMALKSRYNVIPVNCGKDCIKRFIEEKNRGNMIHLLLLDYKLGGMFGDSVARKIKEYNGVKIILISAYELDDTLLKELEEKAKKWDEFNAFRPEYKEYVEILEKKAKKYNDIKKILDQD